MSVVAFSETIRVEGEVTRKQLQRLAQLSRIEDSRPLSSYDRAVIRSVVESLKVRRSPTKSTSVGIPGS